MADPELVIAGERVTVRLNQEPLAGVAVADLVRAVARAAAPPPSCGILPDRVRLWIERNEVVGVVVEVPPHARTVRWLLDSSPAKFGPGARYERYFLAFPYVELLLVFRRGALTGRSQLYFRRAPLGSGDEELLLPRTYNVAAAYGLRAWVCLVQMEDVSALPWPRKIDAVVSHVFTASFNRSAEAHEGNSYWSRLPSPDPRVASVDAWQEATRANPRFPLEVPWASAGATATGELTAMLDGVVAARPLRTAADLYGALTAATARGARR